MEEVCKIRCSVTKEMMERVDRAIEAINSNAAIELSRPMVRNMFFATAIAYALLSLSDQGVIEPAEDNPYPFK